MNRSRGDDGDDIIRFYDNISAGYDGIMGAHTSVTTCELDEVFKAVEQRQFKRVFEIGCGTGALTRSLAAVSDYIVAIDLSPQMVNAARETLRQSGCDNWIVRQADFMAVPPDLVEQSFNAIFFWGNGMCHIPPCLYSEFAAAIARLLEPGGIFVLQLRDGREWVKLAGKLDPVSRHPGKANFVHIYAPVSPQVGDRFECVIVAVQCNEAGEITGKIVSPPVRPFFNDCEALVREMAKLDLRCKHRFLSKGLSALQTLIFIK